MILRALSTVGRRLFSAGPVLRNSSEVNTNVMKDVILYKHDNSRFFALINAFSGIQYAFWTFLAYQAHTGMKDIPVDDAKLDPDAKWYERYNLGSPFVRRSIIGASFIFGTGTVIAAWMFTVRSVRYLVLHKGGKFVSFVTYSPWGQNLIMKVPISATACQHSRKDCPVNMAIKIKKKAFYYLVDMKGEFRNPLLFDHTVGLHRKL